MVRRENAALTHEAETSIQPDESPPGGNRGLTPAETHPFTHL